MIDQKKKVFGNIINPNKKIILILFWVPSKIFGHPENKILRVLTIIYTWKNLQIGRKQIEGYF